MVRYHRPLTLSDALALRAANDVVVLAGGTDIYPARAARAGWGDHAHKDVLDISRLDDLSGISVQGDYWRIGALTTWSQMIAADLPPAFDGLKRAARAVGGVQIQNRGTLVGNICTASPAGDGIPNLLALDAQVELASAIGSRVVPLHTFIVGYRHTVCRPDEIVTALLIPRPQHGACSHFLKLGARKYLVISIVMAAGVVELNPDGTIAAARLAIGACSAVAQRLVQLEIALVGQPLAAASEIINAAHFAHLTPLDDIRASADYRRHAALAVTRDLLSEIAMPAQRRAS